MVSGDCVSSLVTEKMAAMGPPPEGANLKAMLNCPPGGMAMGKAGTGKMEKSLLPLVRLMAEMLRGAVPTLSSCTGMVRSVPLNTVPKPTVAMGFVARRGSRPVLTPVPLVKMRGDGWASLQVIFSQSKASPGAVGSKVTWKACVAPGAMGKGRTGIAARVKGAVPKMLMAEISRAASPQL